MSYVFLLFTQVPFAGILSVHGSDGSSTSVSVGFGCRTVVWHCQPLTILLDIPIA